MHAAISSLIIVHFCKVVFRVEESLTFPDEQAEQGQEGSGAEEELVHGSSGC